MSERDFYNLREMIRRLQRQVATLEKRLEEKSVTT
jgi:DNA-binding protein YbaB